MKTFTSHQSINFEQVEFLRKQQEKVSKFSKYSSLFRVFIQLLYIIAPIFIVNTIKTLNGEISSSMFISFILLYIITSFITFQKFFKENDFLTLYAILSFIITLILLFSFQSTFF